MRSLKSRERTVCARTSGGTRVLLRRVCCVFFDLIFRRLKKKKKKERTKKGEKHKLATRTVMPQSQSYT